MYLAIDIGTTNCKAAVSNGERYEVEQQECKLYVDGDRIEQVPHEWWEALRSIVPKLLVKADVSPSEVRGICVTGHSPSVVPVDIAGQPLRNCLIWQDTRAVKQAEFIREMMGETSDPSYFEPKILWIKEHEPEIYRQTACFFQPKDYIIRLLTGESVTDHAAGHFIKIYNPASREEYSEKLEMDLSKTPRVMNSWDIVGVTRQESAEQLGLRAGIPVVAGGIDAYCEALGAGVIDEGQICDMTGTSSCIMLCLNRGDSHHVVPHVIPNRNLLISPMSSTGGSLDWFLKTFAGDEHPSSGYFHIEDALCLSPSGAHGLIFLPYLVGERSPIWDKHAKGVFFGITKNHTKSDFLRSVLEGVALGVRHNIETMEKLGFSGTCVHATGGGARVDSWNLIKADVTRLPYYQMEILEGALLGGILLAAHAVDGKSFPQLVDEYVHVRNVFLPKAAEEPYELAFFKYKRVYELTRELMVY